jgi:hypothetical protein
VRESLRKRPDIRKKVVEVVRVGQVLVQVKVGSLVGRVVEVKSSLSSRGKRVVKGRGWCK